VMGFFYENIKSIPSLFVILYGLTFFFSNIGPNTTTYILSAESFPKSIRSTAHGISAAFGKLGALFGVAIFPSFVNAFGVGPVFLFCGIILVVGLVVTLVFIRETKGKKLSEEESEENEDLTNNPDDDQIIDLEN